jgi:multidrug transporter EmrE-like cation transporter
MSKMLLLGVLYVAYAVANTSAIAFIKEAGLTSLNNWRAIAFGRLSLGGGLYVIAFSILVFLLRNNDASFVFTIAIGCSILVSNLVGAYFFDERISFRKILGTLILLCGIAMTLLGATR